MTIVLGHAHSREKVGYLLAKNVAIYAFLGKFCIFVENRYVWKIFYCVSIIMVIGQY